MIEQPLPRGDDQALVTYESPIPLCADESCLDSSELAQAAQRYQMINIKLDKTGGLTEALTLASQAKAQGLELMVGNMLGTSLAMAPSSIAPLIALRTPTRPAPAAGAVLGAVQRLGPSRF